MTKSASWRCVVWVACLTAATARGADELKPSWACLPDTTALVTRIPSGEAFAEALRKQTRFGALLFNVQRYEKLGKLLNDKDQSAWDELREQLAKYDLKPSDLGSFFHGDAGYALALLPRMGQFPRPIGLGWAAPSGDLAERLEAAVNKALEEKGGEELAPKRTDLELGGHKVMHLALPLPKAEVDADDDDDKPKEAAKAEAEHERVLHLLLGRIENHLFLAHSFGLTSPDEDADAELEALKDAFGRFLTVHTDDSPGRPPLLEIAGAEGALPGGIPVFELFADPQQIVKGLHKLEFAQIQSVIELLGIEQLGPIAYRAALEPEGLRSGVLISAPSPRKGLLALLDQPKLDARPPDWVPADVISYQQLSFDLGAAYKHIVGLIEEEFGPVATAAIDNVNAQLEQQIQADLPTLLSSIGNRHSFLNFAAKDAANPDVTPSALDRSAFVWQIKDEELWLRILKLSSQAGAGKLSEEQGFTGVRVESQAATVGAFVGRGHLIVTIGADVIENVLAALRHPPEGAAALANAPLLARAGELLAPQPGLSYQVTDMNRYVQSAFKSMKTLFAVAEHQAAETQQLDDDSRKTLGALRDLMPGDEELEGVFGVVVGQGNVNEHGLVFKSVLELPAAGSP